MTFYCFTLAPYLRSLNVLDSSLLLLLSSATVDLFSSVSVAVEDADDSYPLDASRESRATSDLQNC